MKETTGEEHNGKDEVERRLEDFAEYMRVLWGKLKEHLRDPKFIVELLALVGLLIYTGYTIKMYYANRDAAVAAEGAANTAARTLTDSRIHFVAEQRPIIWLTNQVGAPVVVRNPKDSSMGQILWAWHFTNYGKTPPNKIGYRHYFKFGNEAPIMSYGEENGDIGAPTPPGKDDFSSVVSAPMKMEKINKLISAGQVSIIVVVDYTDVSGNPYQTGICLHRTNFGSIAYCEGNYIK